VKPNQPRKASLVYLPVMPATSKHASVSPHVLLVDPEDHRN
jgi:hypothetical protein